MGKPSMTRKSGVGIMEALVASAVLGILLVSLIHLQTGNRDSLLRIRGRDGAVAVAQNVIDSLNAIGLASVKMDTDAEGNNLPIVLEKQVTWKGSPGLVVHTMKIDYTVTVNVSETNYSREETSDLRNEEHVYAKRLDLVVEWPFKNSIQSISITGVIR